MPDGSVVVRCLGAYRMNTGFVPPAPGPEAEARYTVQRFMVPDVEHVSPFRSGHVSRRVNADRRTDTTAVCCVLL